MCGKAIVFIFGVLFRMLLDVMCDIFAAKGRHSFDKCILSSLHHI
jgi:hypothetical protein